MEWEKPIKPFVMISNCQKLYGLYKNISHINPLTAKLFNRNFYPLEVVSRWRDPQLQVSDNYSDLTKWEVNCFQILLIDVTFYL